MIPVYFDDNGITYDRNAFFQYDYGRKLEIHGLNLPDGTLFHFAPKNNAAHSVISSTVNGITTVPVPQIALEIAGVLNVYIYQVDNTSGVTIKAFDFNVKQREKPGNYAPPDEPNIVQQLRDKLDQIIETGIATYTPDPQDVIDIIDDHVPTNLITNNDAATIPGTAWDAVRGAQARIDIDTIKMLISNTRFYSNIIQLGLTATAGMNEIVTAMQIPSMAMLDTYSDVQYDLPSAHCVVFIVKLTMYRTMIFCYSYSTGKLYYNPFANTLGTWKEIQMI